MEDYEDEIIVNDEELFRIEGEKLKQDLHRSVGALTFLNAEAQRGAGSAILISQDIILTGAHNIFDKKKQCEYSDFKFYIGANGEAQEFYQIEGFRYPPEFRQCPNSQKLPYDYAIMKLKKPIRFDSYLPLSLLCEQCLPLNNQKYLKIFGFPSAYPRDPNDPPNYVRPYKNNFLYLDEYGKRMRLYQYGLARANRISFIDTSRFKIGYKINTLGGQSGCPVIMDDSIIAVHVGGDKAQYNVGRIVDFSFISNAQKWRKQLNTASFGLKIDSICKHNDQILQKWKYKLALPSQRLSSVNLSEYPNLLKLDLSANNLQAINLSLCPRVTQVNLRQNRLHEISLSSSKYVINLNLSDNKFHQIDLSTCQQLSSLYLSNNYIEAIDVRRNKQLRDLRLDSNLLKTIQLGFNKELQKLDISRNGIQTIDLHTNIKIQQLKLSSCKLIAIDLSSNIDLHTLELNSNNLSSVDLRSNGKLIYLSLWNNQIAEINLSNNRNLQKLLLFNNCLAEIQLLNNQKLDLLQIHSNKLKRIQLTIAGNEADVYKNYSFRNQDSSECVVELRCDSQVVFDIVENWKTQYSAKKYNFKIF